MLAFRRQHHQEIAIVLSDLDATERRITELYTKAVEQLGSDKAPVRFGGLYALERLAQDNPAHRQTIVNVICAYLRMPFSPTAPASKPEPEAAEGQKEPGTESETRTDGIGGTWQQERQVRLTAQRILAEHLRDDRAKDQQSTDPPSSRFWNNIRLDLTGATLIDFNLVNGVMADANFHGAAFSGDASFGGATFTGDARFGGATFTGDASFSGATFTATPGSAGRPSAATPGSAGRPSPATPASVGRPSTATPCSAGRPSAAAPGSAGRPSAASPGSARRPSPATPGSTRRPSPAPPRSARRPSPATPGSARRPSPARLVRQGDLQPRRLVRRGDLHRRRLVRRGDLQRRRRFDRAAFTGDAWFGEATFTGDAGFGEATFTGDAWFDRATFSRGASFDEATFSGDAGFGEAAFSGGAWFGEATFSGGADALHFEQARILSPGASHVWPTGWRLADADGGGYTVVRANDGGGSWVAGRRAPPQWSWPSSRCQDNHGGAGRDRGRGGGWVAPRPGDVNFIWLSTKGTRVLVLTVLILPGVLQGQPCSMECRT